MEGLVSNSPLERKKLLSKIMPTYLYEVLNGSVPTETFEIDQDFSDSPLTSHPITKEPVRKILSPSSISLKHTDSSEKRVLSDENLSKHGFNKYEKSDANGTFHRTAGKEGPRTIG